MREVIQYLEQTRRPPAICHPPTDNLPVENYSMRDGPRRSSSQRGRVENYQFSSDFHPRNDATGYFK